MRCAELSLPQGTLHIPAAVAASGRSVVPAKSEQERTRLRKCRDVLKVLLRTSNDVRRLLREAASEIGEIVGGDLGREVGRLGASFMLGLMSDALLNDPAGQSAPDPTGEVV